MKMTQTIGAAMLMLALFLLPGCGDASGGHAGAQSEHVEGDGHGSDSGDHAGHGHGENGGHAEEGHAEEGHGGDGHDEHGEEVVRLTRAQLDEAGVEIRPLSGGVIATHVTLPAEVGLNMDTV
ncbi:MAG TPA: hypothetical protein ENK11_07050, partial [Phycisphaerales bacterium]|nr:hypothetical protein [Phycisphaerales bacterium]